MRPLSKAAIDILRSLAPSGPLVFPATRGNGEVIMSGFKKFWKRLARLGELHAEVTPHVLRRSFASLAADLGYSEPVIAALVGHKGRSTTSRYLHSADAVLLAAADKVANRTVELLAALRDTANVTALYPMHTFPEMIERLSVPSILKQCRTFITRSVEVHGSDFEKAVGLPISTLQFKQDIVQALVNLYRFI